MASRPIYNVPRRSHVTPAKSLLRLLPSRMQNCILDIGHMPETENPPLCGGLLFFLWQCIPVVLKINQRSCQHAVKKEIEKQGKKEPSAYG